MFIDQYSIKNIVMVKSKKSKKENIETKIEELSKEFDDCISKLNEEKSIEVKKLKKENKNMIKFIKKYAKLMKNMNDESLKLIGLKDCVLDFVNDDIEYYKNETKSQNVFKKNISDFFQLPPLINKKLTKILYMNITYYIFSNYSVSKDKTQMKQLFDFYNLDNDKIYDLSVSSLCDLFRSLYVYYATTNKSLNPSNKKLNYGEKDYEMNTTLNNGYISMYEKKISDSDAILLNDYTNISFEDIFSMEKNHPLPQRHIIFLNDYNKLKIPNISEINDVCCISQEIVNEGIKFDCGHYVGISGYIGLLLHKNNSCPVCKKSIL